MKTEKKERLTEDGSNTQKNIYIVKKKKFVCSILKKNWDNELDNDILFIYVHIIIIPFSFTEY